jgi:hypothetical protein
MGRRREYCHRRSPVGVERLNLVAVGVDEQHTVVKQR